MMTIKKNWPIFLISVLIYSCSPMDEYKDLITNGGEISYTGKIDSVLVYSGRNRVMIEGLLLSDPKITECRVYWNSKQDSVSIPIQRSEGVDTVRYVLALPENIYTFEIYTFDSKMNKSVPVLATGISYGESYEKELPNRVIAGAPTYVEGEGVRLKWYPMDKTLGPIATVISYQNIDDKTVDFKIDASSNEILIKDYKKGGKMTHRTLFIPEALCIDTFKSIPSKAIIPIQKIDKTNWSIFDYSSEESEGEGPINGRAQCLIDDDNNTFWHSNWSSNHPNFPHYITINLNKQSLPVAIELVPRQGANVSLKDFKVLGSIDGDVWVTLGTYKMEQIKNLGQVFILEENIEIKYIKVFMESAHNTDPHTHLGEIYLFE